MTDKKASSSKKGATNEGTPTANSQDSGPGTGTDAPAPEGTEYPSTVVDPEGNALTPPKDQATQTEPKAGIDASSTDHVYAAAGGSTIAGETYDAIVGEDGKKISGDSLFRDEGASKTHVVAAQRVYEEFYYPNTTEKARRLLFAEGRRVPRGQAEQIKARLAEANGKD